MANVMLAARTAAADVFTTVSHTTTAVSAGARSLSELANYGASHAAAYRRRGEQLLEEREQTLLLRRKAELAHEDTEFFRDIAKRLSDDKQYREFYAQALKNREALEDMAKDPQKLIDAFAS